VSGIKLSIIVPCYNEAENLPFLIRRFFEISKPGIQIVLVDNGSTDNTAQVLLSELLKYETHPFKIVTLQENKGYGYGILSGLEKAEGDVLAWTHADMQTEPYDVIRAFECFSTKEHENWVIKGQRQNRPLLDTFLTWGMTVIASTVLGVPLKDVNAQPKLFHKNFYAKYIRGQAPYDFSLDLFLLYCAQKYGSLETIPVKFCTRLHGESKGGGGSLTNRWKLVKRTYKYIFALRKKIKHT